MVDNLLATDDCELAAKMVSNPSATFFAAEPHLYLHRLQISCSVWAVLAIWFLLCLMTNVSMPEQEMVSHSFSSAVWSFSEVYSGQMLVSFWLNAMDLMSICIP